MNLFPFFGAGILLLLDLVVCSASAFLHNHPSSYFSKSSREIEENFRNLGTLQQDDMNAIVKLSEILYHPIPTAMTKFRLRQETLQSMSSFLEKNPDKYAPMFTLAILTMQDPHAILFVPHIKDNLVFDLSKQQRSFNLRLNISEKFMDRIRIATSAAFDLYRVRNLNNHIEIFKRKLASMEVLGKMMGSEGYKYLKTMAKNPANCIYRLKALIINPYNFFEDGCLSEELNAIYHRLHDIFSSVENSKLDLKEVKEWVTSFAQQKFDYGAREGLFGLS